MLKYLLAITSSEEEFVEFFGAQEVASTAKDMTIATDSFI
jgi:hypothetical protein